MEPLNRFFEASCMSGLYADNTLHPNAVRLYLILKQLRKTNDGYCYASNTTLATLLNVCTRTITGLLKILREKGWITVELTISGEGSQKRFFRKIYVNNDNVNSMREIVATCDDDDRADNAPMILRKQEN